MPMALVWTLALCSHWWPSLTLASVAAHSPFFLSHPNQATAWGRASMCTRAPWASPTVPAPVRWRESPSCHPRIISGTCPPDLCFSAPDNHPIEEGQIVTIEPGYYKAKAYGIRIENVVEVVKVGDLLLRAALIAPLPSAQGALP